MPAPSVPATPGRPAIDVVDSTWLGLTPERLAGPVADPARWRSWWPEFVLEVDELRGPKGVKWLVRSDDRGLLAGSMEIWLQQQHVGSGDEVGTLAHFFLRLDRRASAHPSRPLRRRDVATLVEAHRRRAKQLFWGLSDELDPGRLDRVAAPRARGPVD